MLIVGMHWNHSDECLVLLSMTDRLYICRLVQWCHGAPGFLPLAAKMAALESGPAAGKLRSAAQKAADVIWGRGLLLKVQDSLHLVLQNHMQDFG